MGKQVRLCDLNDRQHDFIIDYAITGDELESYKNAGYSTTGKNWRGEARKNAAGRVGGGGLIL